MAAVTSKIKKRPKTIYELCMGLGLVGCFWRSIISNTASPLYDLIRHYSEKSSRETIICGQEDHFELNTLLNTSLHLLADPLLIAYLILVNPLTFPKKMHPVKVWVCSV